MTRLVGVDVARCLALLGMVATHMLAQRSVTGDLTWSHELAGGRASALFAVLAGVSIALTTGRRTPVHGSERVARSAGLVVRACLVALLGLVLAELDTGVAVILTYYGVLFLCALPFLGLRSPALFALAGVWLLLAPVVSHLVRTSLPDRGWSSPSFAQLADPGPLLSELFFTGYYPVVPWLTYLLVGMAVGRLDLSRRRVALLLAAGGGLLAVAATVVSDALTRREDVVRALLSDPAPLGAGQPTSGPELLDQVAGGMFGTTPTGVWQWLLVRAPHSATPFDLAQTIGSALLVLGLVLVVLGLLPPVGQRAAAVLFGAGTATLTLYSLHIILRWDGLLGWVEPDAFVWHVLVLGAVGSVLVALGRRGPLETGVGAVAGGATEAARLVAGPGGREQA